MPACGKQKQCARSPQDRRRSKEQQNIEKVITGEKHGLAQALQLNAAHRSTGDAVTTGARAAEDEKVGHNI